MIEIVCREGLPEEKDRNICLPKNIRQVGSPVGRHKIYMEDYVYTYLRTIAQKKESCAAIFLGKSQVAKDIRYTFISGALECGNEVFQWDNICLDDSFWEYLDRESKQYFPEKEIVGWFLGKTGQAMELTPASEAAHRKYFSGRDKVLMLMDVLEEEEVFFIYDQGYLQKREGYYIYYEKNISMQEYMISKKEEERRLEELAVLAVEPQEHSEFAELHRELKAENSLPEKVEPQEEPAETESKEEMEEELLSKEETEEPPEETKLQEFQKLRKELEQEPENLEKIFAKSNLEEPKTQAEEALESYRNMILIRQGRQIEKQNRNFLYTASSFFLVVVCVLGITTINNYRKMQEVEDVLHVMKSEEAEEKRTENENGPVVESVASQVEPLEETVQTGEGAAGAEEKTDAPTTSEETAGQELAQPETVPEPAGQEAAQSESAGQESDKPAASDDQQAAEPQEEPNSTGTTQETAASQPAEPRYYTVQPGDTLASICINIYHTQSMMGKVCEANGIENGDKIYAGQKLLLP